MAGGTASAGGADGTGADGAGGAPRLRRQLGTGDAVVVGVSSMLGAGVFAALAPAAAAAGAEG
ncbi:amino acid permease, partial [Pseudokineococcus marinus]|nr:amino acid permease [Pseudokineococcus marinus]